MRGRGGGCGELTRGGWVGVEEGVEGLPEVADLVVGGG